METEGGVSIPSVTSSSSPPDDDFQHPDSSPVGSPDLANSHFPLPPSSNQTPPPPPALSDDLRDKIIKQVEYYFSDENLSTDNFLMKYVTKDKEGFVPIGVIASFKKMKKLTKDVQLLVSALRQSSVLVVSSSGKKVRRLHPLPVPEVKDPMLCTVLVENLPRDHSVENLRRVFGEAGIIKNIVIHDPHAAAKEPKKVTVAEKLLSGKLYALIEYDTVEAAEKAVATLNNEQDWRYGLRVKLLKKKSKSEQKKKVWRDLENEKHSSVQVPNPVVDEENHYSSEHHDDYSHDEEEGDHLEKDKNVEHVQKEKNGEHTQKENNGHKNRHRGRGRRQKFYGPNGQGHGTHSSSHGSGHTSGHAVEPSKPPPGPKMPDGTRGFTMGRGRPLVTDTC